MPRRRCSTVSVASAVAGFGENDIIALLAAVLNAAGVIGRIVIVLIRHEQHRPADDLLAAGPLPDLGGDLRGPGLALADECADEEERHAP